MKTVKSLTRLLQNWYELVNLFDQLIHYKRFILKPPGLIWLERFSHLVITNADHNDGRTHLAHKYIQILKTLGRSIANRLRSQL